MKRAGAPPRPERPPAAAPPDPIPSSARAAGRLPDGAVAALLVLVVLGTLLATRPLIGVPMNDDFSYARSAEAFAEWGRVVYNGWGSPLLLPQILYGALVIRVFGFDWGALQITGLVMAALCTTAMYLLARAAGASVFWSVVATGVLTLNPIFLSVTPTFMTDIPSLFLLLAALLVLARSLTRDGPDGSVGIDTRRLWASAALGLIAGGNRQISWVAYGGALLTLVALLPPGAPRRRLVPPLAVVAATAAGLTLWFNRQPYTVPANVTPGLLVLVGYTNIALMFVYKILNLLGLFVFPLALPAVWASRGKRRVWLPVLLALCLVPVFHPFGTRVRVADPSFRLTAYGQYFTASGVVVGGVHGFPKRPVVLPPVVVNGLAVTGAAGLALAVFLLAHAAGKARAARRERRLPESTVAVALATTAVLQVGAAVPWFAQMNLFDRYLLFLLPGLLILFAAQASRPGVRVPDAVRGVAAALLALVWVVGYGFTAEYMNYTRARADLYARLLRRGIAPENIDGGFEYLADTQVRRVGHINNALIRNPPGAFREGARAGGVTYEPQLFPVIDARYRLSIDPEPDPAEVDPEPLLTTRYASPIFAPRERLMFVYRVRRSGDGDGAAAADAPAVP